MHRDGDTGPASSDAGSTAGEDAGRDGGGARTDGGSLPEQPLLVVLGNGGRTLVSCDDGRTWVGDRSDSSEDSDHGSFTGRALVYGGGVFVHAIGWGEPPRVRRSHDGVVWGAELLIEDAGHGIWSGAYGDGVFVLAGSGRVIRSVDGGETWSDNIPSGPGHANSAFGGGRFVATGDDRLVYSEDGGLTWSDAGGDAAECDGSVAYGNDVFVSVSGDVVCRSTDGGRTWSVAAESSGAGSVMFDGERFLLYGYNDPLLGTPDGFAPTAALRTPAPIASLTVTDEGTYVALPTDSRSRILRSNDDRTSFEILTIAEGPTMRRVAFGRADRPAACD